MIRLARRRRRRGALGRRWATSKKSPALATQAGYDAVRAVVRRSDADAAARALARSTCSSGSTARRATRGGGMTRAGLAQRTHLPPASHARHRRARRAGRTADDQLSRGAAPARRRFAARASAGRWWPLSPCSCRSATGWSGALSAAWSGRSPRTRGARSTTPRSATAYRAALRLPVEGLIWQAVSWPVASAVAILSFALLVGEFDGFRTLAIACGVSHRRRGRAALHLLHAARPRPRPCETTSPLGCRSRSRRGSR